MSLTLRVISMHAGAMGAGAVRDFSNGGVIGRAAGSDWVLPDPEKYVSSSHCSIIQENGAYYLTDTSTNGTYLNDLNRPIGRGAPVRLNEGDRLFVGEYEIAVHVQADANLTSPPSMPGYGTDVPPAQPGPPTSSPTDPFAAPPTTDPFAAPPPAPDPFGAGAPPADPFAANPPAPAPSPGPAAPAPDPHGASPETMDPLAALDHAAGQTAGPASDWARTGAPMSDQGPVHEDHMDIPSQVRAPIPDDWDATHYGSQQTPPAAAPQANTAPGAIPDNWDATQYGNQEPAPPPTGGGRGGIPDDWDSTQYGQSAAPPQPQGPPGPPALPPEATQAPAATVQLPMAGGDPALHQLLAAAGVDPAKVPPEYTAHIMQVAGQIFREVVHGMMDVLTARAQLKNEFRIAATTMKPVQNNPLKFSVNVDDAIMNLLMRTGEGYLEPVEAVKEGFDDIRAHQMAMLAGMRAAFDLLMQHFAPDALSARFAGGKGGLLKGKRNWDRYSEMMEQFAKDPDATFRELFGDEFARAYEEQMTRLSGANR